MSITLRRAKLVIGEGITDQRFFDRLIQANGLNDLQALFPGAEYGKDGTGGRSKFGTFLLGLEVSSQFAKVQRIVLVTDHDDAASFSDVCEQLVLAGYKPPKAPKVFSKTKDKPEVAIVLVPETGPGCLEVTCVSLGLEKWPTLEQPLDTFMNTTPAAGWSVTRQAKMRLQALLAATCEDRPETSFQDHWHQDPKYHIPTTGPLVAPLVDFLRAV